VEDIEVVLAVVAAVVVLTGVARRVGIAYPVVLTLGGLVFGLVPGVPSPRLDPDLVFFVFLPPLLYSAAYLSPATELRDRAAAIGALAVGLVLVTAAGVAVVAHVLTGMDWAVAFVLGAALGPTDPVSASAVIRDVGAPNRIETVLEGEALVNDGTALTLLAVALAAVGSSGVSLPGAVGRFAVIACGGVAIGAAVGWASTLIRRRVDDAELEIATSLLTAYVSYILADRLGTSGVLGAVAAGLVVQLRAAGIQSARTRLQGMAFWSVLVFLGNASLFLLVGLQFGAVVDGIHDHDVWRLLGYAAAVAGVVIALRIAWMMLGTPLVARATEVSERHERRMLRREQLTMGWCGMRGALSLAAALTVPLTHDGAPFPDRSLLIFLTFTTILVTLPLPALTLPWLLRRLGLSQSGQRRDQRLRAELRLAHAALARLDELDGGELPGEVLRRARDVQDLRVDRLESRLDADGDGSQKTRRDARAARRVLRELLEAQRRELAEAARDRAVPGDVARELEDQLDFEESRLTRGR
jgi:Na+/H+ antiporter